MQTPIWGWGRGSTRLAAQAQGGGVRSGACGGEGGCERVGVHVRVPGCYLLPSSSSSPPLFLSLYDALCPLAARALMSGASAGADWADGSVRESAPESGSPVTRATGQATPGRRRNEPRLSLRALRAARVHLCRLPAFLSGCFPVAGTRRAALGLPGPHSVHPHSRREANLRCLVTTSRVPLRP